MKAASLAGILLLVIGIASLAYQGITYKTHKDLVDVGPIHASKTETHTIPISPLLGTLALIGGVGLLLVGAKQ
jgi:hypothetical protein